MDPKLAEIYGTNSPEAEDTEKLASAQLLEALSDDGSIDLSKVDPADIEAIAQEVLAGQAEGNGEGGQDAAAAAAGGEDQGNGGEGGDDVELQEKTAQADFLGRVMAHAYVQELKSIDGNLQKEAAGKVEHALRMGKDKLKKGVFDAKLVGHKAGTKAKELAGKAGAKAKEHGAKGVALVKKHPKAAAGAAAAGAAAAGFAAGRKSKTAGAEGELSALDQLAQARALEMLAEAGITVEQETPAAEKTASDKSREVLAAAVEARAVEMLEANGYEFQPVE